MASLIVVAMLALAGDGPDAVFSETPAEKLSESAVIEWFGLHRQRMLETHKTRINELTQQRRKARIRGNDDLAKRIDGRIKAHQRQMSELKRSHPPIPVFEFERARVGYFGLLDMGPDELESFSVERVTPKGSIICTRVSEGEEKADPGFYVIRGVDSSGIVVRSDMPLKGVFRVVETVKIGGEFRPLLEPFDPVPYWEAMRKKQASKEGE